MKIMKKRTILAVSFVLGQGVSTASAAPGNASGPAALALAGVVASHSSVLASFDRRRNGGIERRAQAAALGLQINESYGIGHECSCQTMARF